MSGHTVIAASFQEDSKAYQALSELKNAGAEGRVEVLSSAIIARDENGVLSAPEADDQVSGAATVGGGFTGLLIGILGGPVGMLFGWTAGTIVGGAFDLKRYGDSNDVLGQISRFIPAGSTAVVAELNEYADEVVDGIVGGLGGSVLRQSADEVLDEIEAVQEAYEDAERAARKAAREERKAERRENFEERRDALKAKLGIN